MYVESASLDITYRCNLRCRHCYNCSGSCYFSEMDSSQLLYVGRELSSVDFSSVCLCGGEPLCRKEDLLQVAKTIKKNNPSTELTMVSNGLLWTKNIANEIYESGIHTVQFSLDGYTNESYDFIRQSGGQLHRVFSAIDVAIDRDFKVMVSILPHRQNIEEFHKIIDYCASVGVSEVRVQPLMPLGRGESNYTRLCLSASDYDTLASLLASYRSRADIKVIWGDPIDHFLMYQEEGRIPQLMVNAYGEVLISPYLPISIWDLKKRSLIEYLELEIDKIALEHPIVKRCLNKIISVDDLTSEWDSLPKLSTERNLDIVNDLLQLVGR